MAIIQFYTDDDTSFKFKKELSDEKRREIKFKLRKLFKELVNKDYYGNN